MIFKRKIYDEMLAWKRTQNGRTALLLKGARRVGKTTIVKEFAAREYQSGTCAGKQYPGGMSYSSSPRR